MTAALCALAGYLAGSIPFAVIVSRLMGLPDPRTYGSHNIGATNVLRSGNWLAALLTLAGDAAKGGAAVLVARHLRLDDGPVAIVAIAAFLGHVFPVWLRFHGGKGVATAAGVLIALDWVLGLALIGTWLVVAAATRYSSLASLVAAVAAPGLTWWLMGPSPALGAVAAMAIVLIVRHEANIGKLLRGEESRIGGSKPSPPAESA
jgi:glycerol-3-phosphate acyltransferase PlsY